MNSWNKLREEIVYDGWRKIIKKHFLLPGGLEVDFDIIVNNAYVTVAALTEQLEFIVVQQYRPGPEVTLMSFSEGYIDKGETPEQAAARELMEETGYQAQRITLLREMRSAYSTERQVCLLATGCKKVKVQKLDATEFIDVFTMPAADFRKFLRDQRDVVFTNVGCAYLAMDHLGML